MPLSGNLPTVSSSISVNVESSWAFDAGLMLYIGSLCYVLLSMRAIRITRLAEFDFHYHQDRSTTDCGTLCVKLRVDYNFRLYFLYLGMLQWEISVLIHKS